MIAERAHARESVERRSTLEILLLRYAELDPDGAIGQALKTTVNGRTSVGVTDRRCTGAGLERAREVTNPAERLAYLRAVATHGLRRMRSVRSRESPSYLPNGSARNAAPVAVDIADRDPRLAISLAQTLTPTCRARWSNRSRRSGRANNPSEAARWVESLPRQDQGRYAYRVAEPYLAQKQSEALCGRSGSPARRANICGRPCSGSWRRYDPDQALQLAQAAESPAARPEAMGKVLGAIAQTNPSMAMAQLLKMPRRDALGDPRRSGGQRRDADADSSARLAQRHQRQVHAHQAAKSLGYALARRDVEVAADIIDRVPKEARANWITSVALATRTWTSRRAGSGSASMQTSRATRVSVRTRRRFAQSRAGNTAGRRRCGRSRARSSVAWPGGSAGRALACPRCSLGGESDGRSATRALHRRSCCCLDCIRLTGRAQVDPLAR